MFWWYTKNHIGGTYLILNLYIKRVVLRRDIIMPKKGKYVSISKHKKEDGYVIQDKYDSNKYDNLKPIPWTLKMHKPRRILGGNETYQTPLWTFKKTRTP